MGTGPGAEPWEVYTVKGDADTLDKAPGSVCCAPPTAKRSSPTGDIQRPGCC
jgi:hypothetical protein